MTIDSTHLTSLSSSILHVSIQTANGTSLPVTSRGTLSILSFHIPAVSHVTKLVMQLMSAGHITDHDCRIILEPDLCCVQDRRTGTLVGTGPRCLDSQHLWELDWLHLPSTSTASISQSTTTTNATASAATTSISFAQWHHRLGHLCGSHLYSLVDSGVLESVPGDTSLSCMGCKIGKQRQLSYGSSDSVSTRPFDLIHSNVWGSTPFVSKGVIVTT